MDWEVYAWAVYTLCRVMDIYIHSVARVLHLVILSVNLLQLDAETVMYVSCSGSTRSLGPARHTFWVTSMAFIHNTKSDRRSAGNI